LVTTRRAFVIAGATFALGAAAGGSYGYSLALAESLPMRAAELLPSGDGELDELRRLAVEAPVAELVQHRLDFTHGLFRDHPHDPVLWRGIGRLCDAVLGDEPVPDRSAFARTLAHVIERGDPAMTSSLVERVQALRRCAESRE
jgi:hypothetical protein